jgi:hypothetical protein
MRNGTLLTTGETLHRYDQYNASAKHDHDTQEVLASILDTIEARKKAALEAQAATAGGPQTTCRHGQAQHVNRNCSLRGAGVLVGHPVAGRVARCHDGVWLAQRDAAAILVALEASSGDVFGRPVPVVTMRELTDQVVEVVFDKELVS